MKASGRNVMLQALLVAGVVTLGTPATAAAQGVMPVQYHPEIQGYQPAPRYYQPRYQPPPPRQTCWTQNQRVFVGRDNWGQPVYRIVPRRVCAYR